MNGNSDKQRILVVDDSPSDLLLLSKLLEAPDREILQASTGEDALAIAGEHRLALVILDVYMKGKNGYDTAEELRGRDHTRHVPIIFVTGTNYEREQVFRGYDAGAVDFLIKPIEPNLLRGKANVFCELDAQREVIQHQLDEIQMKNDELNRQIEEIKVLQGLVPICAKCKNVRNDTGFWQSIEAYVSQHSEAEFSHSVCPECADQLYPGLLKDTK